MNVLVRLKIAHVRFVLAVNNRFFNAHLSTLKNRLEKIIILKKNQLTACDNIELGLCFLLRIS